MWRENFGAQAFATDGLGNIYANTGRSILELSVAGGTVASGAPQQICPLPALAQLDMNGNYYFAGLFDGTQDFGGITLVGGYTNAPLGTNGETGWQAGYPTCFLAEYDSSGNLIGAASFGPQQGIISNVTDVLPDPMGGCWVGYRSIWGGLAFSNPQSAYVWSYEPDAALASEQTVRLGPPTLWSGCNAIFAPDVSAQEQIEGIVCGYIIQDAHGESADAPLNSSLWWVEAFSHNAKPVSGRSNDLYMAGTVYQTKQPVLRKCLMDSGRGSVAWDVPLTNEQCVLGSDMVGNLYLADKEGNLAMYDEDGTQLWTTNYGMPVVGIVVDWQNDRYVSFEDGSIGQLQPDPPPIGPTILQGPQSQTLFVGDIPTLAVLASGSTPLFYTWKLNGVDVPGGSMPTLLLQPVAPDMGGIYSVVVSNAAGTVTSTAIVRVKSVEFFWGNQMLTNGTYTFSTPPTLRLQNAFANASSYFTLDGSQPRTNSIPYTGPFLLTSNVTARAIGYSGDFLESEMADPVTAIVSGANTLGVTTAGGGSVVLDPPGGSYAAGTAVSLSALPAPGWAFIGWFGDVTGAGTNTSIVINGNYSAQAVFGTTFYPGAVGQGEVFIDPPGKIYAYGTVVRLTGVPVNGNYFSAWAGAVTGSLNPCYFTVTNPTQTVSAIFAVLAPGQSALTVEINGPGEVTVSPMANVYPTNALVTLTAVPDNGQSFPGWTGDAHGTDNPLVLSMVKSRVITANFLKPPVLRVDLPGDGVASGLFRFTVLSAPASIWQLMVSTNLRDWSGLATITNLSGQMLFTDSVPAHTRFYQARPFP